MTLTGRNDPCPCGSGQKYKKCCLPKQGVAHAAERPRQTARHTVMPKLLRFAYGAQFDRDHDVADALFWADRLDALSDDAADDIVESEDGQAKYNAWFIWDLDIDDGVTVADMFLEQRGRSLDAAERAYVDTLRGSHLSLYQVQRVESGRGVHLRDLLAKEDLFVHERLGSGQIVQWDVLGARVVRHGDDGPVFEGGMYLYAVSDKTELLRTLKRCQRQFARKFPDGDRAAFLKRHGMVFNHLWLDLVVLRPLPAIATAEGDEMVFARSVFDVADEAALRTALEARPDIDASDDGAFIWCEDAGEFRRMLGSFRFERQRLVLETTSRERDRRGREWLASVAPTLTTYRATALETVAQTLARRAEQPDTAPDEGLPPDEKARLERELQDAYYRRWLDEPVPALRGATPRAAAASRTLRPLLTDLLREFDNHFARARLEGTPVYDTSWLWGALGLHERPRPGRRPRTARHPPGV